MNVLELKKIGDDSNRMFITSRILNSYKPKQRLIINSNEGQTTNPERCVKILTNHFRKTFQNESAIPISEIKPCSMNQPFNAKEVENAVTSMSNNKSAGCDNVKCELLKYGDKIIFEGIAEILNSIAKTGQYPAEIKKGILVPLPKPGKPKGPPENCRPIILLSVLRKIWL